VTEEISRTTQQKKFMFNWQILHTLIDGEIQLEIFWKITKKNLIKN
jgi:hypothetical protein